MSQGHLSLILLPLSAALSVSRESYVPGHRSAHVLRHRPKTTLHAYGKGSEIWPECNEEPISLSSSFPSGIIPQMVQNMVDTADYTPIDTTPLRTPKQPIQRTTKRRVIKRTISHLLHSAAAASSQRASTSSSVVFSKSPLVVATLLIGLNCVSVKHIASAVGVTLYLIGMTCWCLAPKAMGDGEEVNMPSLPSKGHVPNLVSNPLGNLSNSKWYRIWLRSGAMLSLFLPMLALIGMGVRDVYTGGLESVLPISIKDAFNSLVLAEPMNGVVKKLLGGHIFLVCCQALSESVGRAALLPLPIRILIPVTYNTLRLSALHDWAFYPSILVGELVLSTPLRMLGIANLVYWYLNLMVALPVAVLRYLRAHFYCVEATEITVRKGGENSVGLLS